MSLDAINSVTLLGTVVSIDKQPPVHSTGATVVRIRVKSTSRHRSRRDGITRERSAETVVTLFHQLADRALRVLRVDDSVVVNGHLRSRSVLRDSGEHVFYNDVICDRFIPVRIVEGREDDNDVGDDDDPATETPPPAADAVTNEGH